MFKKCLQCNIDFKLNWKKSKQKYCSRKCVYLSQIGRTHLEITKKKISESNSKPLSQERKKNISNSKKIKISKFEYNSMVKMLMETIYSDRMIQSNLNLKGRPYIRYKNEIIEKFNLETIESNRHFGSIGSNPMSIKENVEFIRDNYKKMTRTEICNHIKYNTSKSKDVVSSFCWKHFGEPPKIISGKFHRGKTMPESIIEKLLIDFETDYTYQYTFRCKDKKGHFIDYAVDFYLPIQNMIIEVHGDYWHGNPTIYESFDSTQRNNRNRDKRKKFQILNQHNIKRFVEIWELDIKNNVEKIKEQIYEYVR